MKNAIYAMTHPNYVGGGYECLADRKFFTGGHKEYDAHIAKEHPEMALEWMCAKEYRKLGKPTLVWGKCKICGHRTKSPVLRCSVCSRKRRTI